ncbi:MAG: hypothetical protein NTW86_09390 [Candidatus Sumerlaeota bacterium]|nr:hypothetical protein [Candidatus Sumerlaeota bacterium]
MTRATGVCAWLRAAACWGASVAMAMAAWDGVKLSPPGVDVVSGRDRVALSPDGSRVAFDVHSGVYSAPIEGGAPATLATFSYGYSVNLMVSPDSSRLVFTHKTDSNFDTLYSVPMAGGALTLINNDLAGETITHSQISPDSQTALYRAERGYDHVFQLYATPIGGGPIVRLNEPLGPERVVDGHFAISPDGSRVFYGVGNQTVIEHPGDKPTFTVAVDALYSVPIAGGSATRLTPDLGEGGKIGDFFAGWALSPDGSHVVYAARRQGDWQRLFSVSAAGGSPADISGPVIGDGPYCGGADVFEISSDSQRVLFPWRQTDLQIQGLYCADLSGGAPVNLTSSMVAGGELTLGFHFTPDRSRAVFMAYLGGGAQVLTELYTSSLGGGPLTKLNRPATGYSDQVIDFKISFDGRYVFYLDHHFDLYRVPVEGGEAMKINGAIPVSEFDFPVDGQLVLFSAWVLSHANLYQVSIDGGASAILNLVPTSDAGTYMGYWISPTGGRVVYEADQDTRAHNGLYSAPLVNPPKLESALDGGGGQVGVTWTDDSPTTPAQYLAFAYDAYQNLFVEKGWQNTMWYPFPVAARAGAVDVGGSGAFHAWISSQMASGSWFPGPIAKTLIVYSGTPHTPTGAWVEDKGGGVWRLHWTPEIYGTWLDQIAIYQNGVGWIAPLDGPSHAFPQFSPWTFLDYGGLAYDLAKGNFFNGWADFTLPLGPTYVFFLNFKAWDAATAGPFALTATP